MWFYNYRFFDCCKWKPLKLNVYYLFANRESQFQSKKLSDLSACDGLVKVLAKTISTNIDLSSPLGTMNHISFILILRRLKSQDCSGRLRKWVRMNPINVSMADLSWSNIWVKRRQHDQGEPSLIQSNPSTNYFCTTLYRLIFRIKVGY